MGRYSSRGGPLGCCCFCLVAGLALLIAGIVFLSKADPDARQKEIAAYNQAVLQWDAQAVADFQARGPFRVTVDIGAWANASAADLTQIAVQQGSGILPLPQQRAAFVVPPTPIIMGSAGAFFPASVQVSGTTIKMLSVYDVNNVLVANVPITLSRTQTNSVGSKSSCQYGRKSGSTCYIYLYFSGPICITLNQKTGSYAYAGGCALYFGNTAFAATYGIADPAVSQSPVNYGDVTITDSGSQPGMVTWGSNIVIRSNMDPYAVAVQVTGGYPGAFGERSAMLMSKGWILAGVGIGLLAPFLLCVLGLCACACLEWFSCPCAGRSMLPGSITTTTTTTTATDGAVPIQPGAGFGQPVNPNSTSFKALFSQRFLSSLDATNRPFQATGNALRTATRSMRFGWANNTLPVPAASPTGHNASLMADNTLPGKGGASSAAAASSAPPMLATPMIVASSSPAGYPNPNPYAYPPSAGGMGGLGAMAVPVPMGGSGYPPMAGAGSPYPQPGYPGSGYPPAYNGVPGNRPSAL